MQKNSYLPVGTVFRQKDEETLPLMVIGYFPIIDNKMYDYSVVIYPQGVITRQSILAFNQEDIDEVLFMGYEDDLSKELTEKLTLLSEKIQNLDLSQGNRVKEEIK